LRYFFDPRNYQRTGKNDVPLPDKVALNGPAAKAAYRKGGYPSDQMVEVEALRYLYLADLPPIQSVANAPLSSALLVLVLVDYLPTVTHRQMQWLVEAAALLPPDTRYIVKAHPSCPVKASDYPSLHLQITALPLAKLLSECDVVYSSNITSAAVDAYCAGLPVVSVLDSNSSNMSPLRGMEGVMYVTNPTELAAALRTARDCAFVVAESYFCLDKGLPRWRKLLGLSPTGVTKSVET
jgi:surface carbohydrate biosynthesis protein (TIGR04326 family)